MDARLPDAFLKSVVELLPAQVLPGPQGDRPQTRHDVVMRVIWFVLTVGCRRKDVPREMGCSGETAHTRLKLWQEAGLWQWVHHRILRELKRHGRLKLYTTMIDSAQGRAFGGGDRGGPWIAVNQARNTRFWAMRGELHRPCRAPPRTSVIIVRFFPRMFGIRRLAAHRAVLEIIRRSFTPMPATTAMPHANR